MTELPPGFVLDQPKKGDAYTGSVLPLSRDADGKVSFDPNAGILGSLKRAFTLPGEVMKGEASPNDVGRVLEAATVATPMSAAARAGEAAIPGVVNALKKPDVKPPSAEVLKEAADEGYKAVRNLGVDYDSGAVTNIASGARQALEQDGVFAELAPKTFKILEKLSNAPPGSVASISNLEAARRSLGHAAGDFTNKTERFAAQRVIDGLDQFIANPPAQGVVAGPATAAGRATEAARGNYAAAMRSDKVTGAIDDAERSASVANSGQNVDNNIRRRIASIIAKPKEARGFSPEELAQAERVARGSGLENAMRGAGNLMGGGGGLGAAVAAALGGGAGQLALGPWGAVGAAAPVLGYALKQSSSTMSRRQANKLDELIRKRSPLYREMLDAAPGESAADLKRTAVLRALMLGADN